MMMSLLAPFFPCSGVGNMYIPINTMAASRPTKPMDSIVWMVRNQSGGKKKIKVGTIEIYMYNITTGNGCVRPDHVLALGAFALGGFAPIQTQVMISSRY